jgi:hypothetical protein
VGFQCLPAALKVANCYLYNLQGQCLLCKTGYNLAEAAQCLLPPDALCAAYNTQNLCARCSNSRVQLLNGSCIDPNCQQGTPGNCLQCRSGFAVKEGVCEVSDPNCQSKRQDNSSMC